MDGRGSGDNPPLKLAGYALLAVAAIAAVVGLITLAAGSSGAATPDQTSQAAPPSSQAPPSPVLPPAAPPAGPSNGLAAPPSTAPALPGAGLPADDISDKKGAASVAKAPLRVYNNSLVKGLAERAADDMRDSGWKVTLVSNYPGGNIATSTVYFRPGTSEVSAARSLASSFGLRSEPRFSGIEDATPGLIVIVTKDYQRR
jgi:hypothetical protein